VTARMAWAEHQQEYALLCINVTKPWQDVCLSRAGIVSKQRNILRLSDYSVAPPF